MKRVHSLPMIALLSALALWSLSPRASQVLSAEDGAIEVDGKTHPVPGRLAKIAPTVLHPVEKVYVTLGQRVQKGAVLVELDADEPKAEVESKQASLCELRASLARLQAEPRQEEQEEARACLDNCRICAQEAKHLFDRLDDLHKKGSISEQRYHEARAALAKSDADERAAHMRLQRLVKRPYKHEITEVEARIKVAEGAVKVAAAELEHYTVTAPIEGVVTSLDVSIGTVSRPGTTVWGEIMDLRDIDVRCDLPPAQADRLVVGQNAEVTPSWNKDQRFTGKVVLVNLAADPRTGLVPVVIRIADNRERLRAYIDVKVRLK